MKTIIATLAAAACLLSGGLCAPSTLPAVAASGTSGAAISGWPAAASMTAMSCPSASVCFAVGASVKPQAGIVAWTNDGGATWTIHTDINVAYQGITCPTVTHCYITGGRLQGHRSVATVTVTADGGTTWQVRVLPAGTNSGGGMSCPAAGTCILFGYAQPGTAPKESALITRDGGKTWKAGRPVSQGLVNAKPSCPTARVCYAFGGFGIGTTGNHTAVTKSNDGGQTWTELPNTDMFARSGVPPHTLAGLNGISCPSTAVCYTSEGSARGQGESWGPYGTVFGTTDGGKHWTQLYRAHTSNYPLGPITCPTNRACYAAAAVQRVTLADHAVLSTKDGGRHWAAHVLPVADLSCPTADVCYAYAPTGAVYKTTDGGQSWSALP